MDANWLIISLHLLSLHQIEWGKNWQSNMLFSSACAVKYGYWALALIMPLLMKNKKKQINKLNGPLKKTPDLGVQMSLDATSTSSQNENVPMSAIYHILGKAV